MRVGWVFRRVSTNMPQIRRSILDFVRVTNHCIVLYRIVLYCISRKRYILDTKLLWDGNRKPYAGYRMVSVSMTLSDP